MFIVYAETALNYNRIPVRVVQQDWISTRPEIRLKTGGLVMHICRIGQNS